MKNILKYIFIFSLAVSVMGCESFVEGFEEDPNNPSSESVDVNNMIQGVMLGDALLHEGEMARLAGMWAGQFTGSDRQYVNLNEYLVSAGDFDSPWSTLYYGTVTQARLAKQKARNELNPKVEGIAQILEAHAAGTATALFGDVPFSEVTYAETPKFDPQEEVYASLQLLLDSAIANLTLNRGVLFAEKDIFYAGNAQNWINAAYTLKARYYLQTGDYTQAEAVAAQGIPSPEIDMNTPHGLIYGGNFNVYYSFTVYDRPGYLTAIDAFAPKLIDPALKGEFARNRNNASTDETARFNWYYQTAEDYYDLNYYSVGDGWGAQGFFGAETPFPLVTYAETQLIIAEARTRMGQTQPALDALNAHRAALNTTYSSPAVPAIPATPTTPAVPAVPEYIPYKPLTLVDFAPTVGVENPTAVPVQDALLNEILEERYVTFIGQLNPFLDISRTDNRLNIPAKGAGGKIPERFLYPQSEVNANPNIPSPLPNLFTPTPVNE